LVQTRALHRSDNNVVTAAIAEIDRLRERVDALEDTLDGLQDELDQALEGVRDKD
jgi:polyhydroxyalkanoate synthesis regulator phasin